MQKKVASKHRPTLSTQPLRWERLCCFQALKELKEQGGSKRFVGIMESPLFYGAAKILPSAFSFQQCGNAMAS
eukprot:scaffold19498_cov72-Skeletonema_dohrnii-CCMP3373.AAC.2